MKILNYRIGAFEILLREDAVLSRYYPLIPYKNALIGALKALGCQTKEDCAKKTDEELMQAGLPNPETVKLFRAFLTLYDPSPSKFNEIEAIPATEAEKASLRALYQLPGVRRVRACLYLQAGYTSLEKIAYALPEDIITATSAAILRSSLSCKPPLPKEARTHIAVAKALTTFAV